MLVGRSSMLFGLNSVMFGKIRNSRAAKIRRARRAKQQPPSETPAEQAAERAWKDPGAIPFHDLYAELDLTAHGCRETNPHVAGFLLATILAPTRAAFLEYAERLGIDAGLRDELVSEEEIIGGLSSVAKLSHPYIMPYVDARTTTGDWCFSTVTEETATQRELNETALAYELARRTLCALDNIVYYAKISDTRREDLRSHGIESFVDVRQLRTVRAYAIHQAQNHNLRLPAQTEAEKAADLAWSDSEVTVYHDLYGKLAMRIRDVAGRYHIIYHPAPTRAAFFEYAAGLGIDVALRDQLVIQERVLDGDIEPLFS
ncbi:hypothetical protein C8F01DRAFT_1079283 [Mycena amicta]|nr:hypothetical protein C8F01DRAFT_1079283 [Mycena amicta]